MKNIHANAEIAEPEQEMNFEAISEQDDFDAVWIASPVVEKEEQEIENNITAGLSDLFNSFDDVEYIQDVNE